MIFRAEIDILQSEKHVAKKISWKGKSHSTAVLRASLFKYCETARKGQEEKDMYSSKPVMVFEISIDPKKISEMKGANGTVTIIPFEGRVESELFCGRVLPGAADIQVTNPAGVRHMCARYMFEGTDSAGIPCHLFVENNGYFERDHIPQPFEAYPVFMTDSKLLAPYLHGAHFRAEGHGREGGVEIQIYDIDREDSER